MFGYLRPLQDELKVKEARLYRAVYCGICRAMARRAGQLPRLALQYDAVLPALLWLALSEKEGRMEKRRCVAQPVKAHPVMVDHPALDVAADVCLLLAHRKLKDNAADEHRITAAAGSRLLAGAVKGSQERLGRETVEEVDQCLTRLSQLEREGCSALDEVADASGGMLQALFLAGPGLPEAAKKPLGWLGYQTGRWVYLADCIDDYDQDAQSGAYNVLLMSGQPREEALNLAREACDYAAAQAAAALDLMDLKRYRGLLENYYFAGMPYRLTQLGKKEK